MKANRSLQSISNGSKRVPRGIVVAMAIVIMATSVRGALIVDPGTAGDYAILSKAGISTTAGTSIVGDIGVSPIASTGLTGFGLTLDASGEFATSDLVTGKVFAADYAEPTPTLLGTAVGDMEAAYTDAAGRSNPDHTDLLGGSLNGQTLDPGLYKWASEVTITDSITLNGDASDVWIFQITKSLALANGANILLSGGAQAENIFWQTAEGATLGTTSHFEGILLTAAKIAVQTDASLNGNLYSQTSVTLESNDITQAIPEPAGALLVGMGASVLFLVRRYFPV